MEIKLLFLLILSISFYYSIEDVPKLSKQGMFSTGGSVLHSEGTFDVRVTLIDAYGKILVRAYKLEAKK